MEREIKMKPKIYVANGASCSGKTTFCKKLKYKYIDYDSMWNYNDINFPSFFERLTRIMKENKDKNLALDGYPYGLDKKFEKLKAVGTHEVIVVMTYAPYWLILKRQIELGTYAKEKTKEQLMSEIKWNYETDMETKFDVNEVIFVDSTDFEFKNCNYKEFKENLKVMNRQIEKDELKKYIDSQTYDKYYQTAEGIIQGYSKSEESWNNLKDLVDWNGKKVLDIGCNHGYFSFKVKEDGAREVTGIDIQPDVIKTARLIRKYKKMNVVFRCSEVEEDKKYDIVLILNTFRHIRNKREFLAKVFKISEKVIFETGEIKIENSNRIGRKMVII